jgi:hypothetical protein
MLFLPIFLSEYPLDEFNHRAAPFLVERTGAAFGPLRVGVIGAFANAGVVCCFVFLHKNLVLVAVFLFPPRVETRG